MFRFSFFIIRLVLICLCISFDIVRFIVILVKCCFNVMIIRFIFLTLLYVVCVVIIVGVTFMIIIASFSLLYCVFIPQISSFIIILLNSIVLAIISPFIYYVIFSNIHFQVICVSSYKMIITNFTSYVNQFLMNIIFIFIDE